MFSISNHIIDQILVTSLLRFLFIGGSFSFLVGIGLIFHSELMFRIFDKMNRWISFHHGWRVFEIPRDCWPYIVRYRFILSGFITVGAIFAVIGLITRTDTEAIVPGISSALHLPGLYVSWLLLSIKWFLLTGCAIAIAVGLMLACSVETLSKLETLSGVWVSISNSALYSKSNAMHVGFDNLVMSSPKIAGLIVAVMSMVEVTLVGMQMY
jgi:hypothetical protein